MPGEQGQKRSESGEAGRKERRRMARSAGLIGLLTLLSRVFGLVRDGVVAASFSKRSTDAFFVAFTVPNVFRRLFAEGSLTVAFIPVYTDCLAREGHAAARTLLRVTFGAALVVIGLFCLGGVLGAPSIVKAFAYGLSTDPDQFHLATRLTRVVFPYLLLVALLALAMGVLNAHRHFIAPAFAPVLLNLAIIGAAIGVAPAFDRSGYSPILALSWAVLVGGFLQLVVQVPALSRHHRLVLPSFRVGHPGLRRIVLLMIPSLFGVAVYQMNVVLARQFASFLPEGSISCLYYAQRLIEFPTGIFAAALATAAMPNLATHAAQGAFDHVAKTYVFALRLVVFVMLPATAGLIALARPLVSVLFQRGSFVPEMSEQTAITLVGFAVGLLAAGGSRQTTPVFFALQDTRTPVKGFRRIADHVRDCGVVYLSTSWHPRSCTIRLSRLFG